ncbi:MAG: glycosyltransferase family 4 protein [Halobacteriovoraceae bacterium]|nr:glycosyltransferase family 4 protein [Halobacteriovoraceae bacterium]
MIFIIDFLKGLYLKGENKIQLCRVATVPFAFNSSLKLIEKIHGPQIHVTLVSSDESGGEILKSAHIGKFAPINISREISPFQDLLSLFKLIVFFRKHKFDIVHSNTPKAGLLVSLASIFCPKTKFLHTFTGQRWETLTGFKRKLLRFFDKLIIKLDDKVYTDSISQAKYLEEQEIAGSNQLSCIGEGSFGGIDLEKFDIEKKQKYREEIRKALSISNSESVIVFIGRIVRDKGIVELVQTFENLNQFVPNIKLLLVGPFEDSGDPVPEKTKISIEQNPNILTVGHRSDVEKYICASDLLCLPSYREGFPTVVLEAAALEVPSVVADVIGSIDTIIHNETGLLYTLKDDGELSQSLSQLITDIDKRIELGINARKRVIEKFSVESVKTAYIAEYKRILS